MSRYVTARTAVSGYHCSMVSVPSGNLTSDASPARYAFSRESLLIMYRSGTSSVWSAAWLTVSRYSLPDV